MGRGVALGISNALPARISTGRVAHFPVLPLGVTTPREYSVMVQLARQQYRCS